MAKIIKLTQDHIAECFNAVQSQANERLTDGVIEFKKSFIIKDRKAELDFTPKAWVKMNLLLDGFDGEVGWYGVASRLGEEEDDAYLIEDIVVYPQTVTSATVDMCEPEEMAKWRMDNIDDERLDRLYCHGHSHVRMSTTPSGVDLNHQKEILADMADEGFYIFMIWNKRLERNLRIYDLKKNVQFENADISVGFYDADDDLADFIDGAHEIAKQHVYKTPTSAPKAGTQATPAQTAQKAPVTPTPPKTPAIPPAPPAQKSPMQKSDDNKPNTGGWASGGNFNRGSRFYDYDDESDEVWTPEYGWIPGWRYRQLFRQGLVD